MATSTVSSGNPQSPGVWDDSHPGKSVFIRNSSGAKQEMALLTYNILPGKADAFQGFFNTKVLPFYKAKGATDVHSFIVNNRLFVLGTPEINVPWLNGAGKGVTGLEGLENFVDTATPATINELPVFP